MAERATFTVLDREAPYRAADPGIEQICRSVHQEIVSRTPVDTGRLAAGWQVERGQAVAIWLVTTDVPYARYVEYGTKDMPAHPMIGPALAKYRGVGVFI